VSELQADKESQTFDGHTFTPVINSRSRQLALATYATSPDPNRPWTASPVYRSAPLIRYRGPLTKQRIGRRDAYSASRLDVHMHACKNANLYTWLCIVCDHLLLQREAHAHALLIGMIC
jgi:hypothetical protein